MRALNNINGWDSVPFANSLKPSFSGALSTPTENYALVACPTLLLSPALHWHLSHVESIFHAMGTPSQIFTQSAGSKRQWKTEIAIQWFSASARLCHLFPKTTTKFAIRNRVSLSIFIDWLNTGCSSKRYNFTAWQISWSQLLTFTARYSLSLRS